MKRRALCLLSGGLDSAIACYLMLKQNIEVYALSFESVFFSAKRARLVAAHLDIPIKVINISNQIIEIVKSPKYGYGKNLNPCIDCHILMLKIAKEFKDKNNFDFVVTGEVLGERPKSQTKQALKIVEKESQLLGYLLRPLSAKLLEPTVPEIEGWVKRDELLDISGRGRKVQFKLAEEFKLRDYATPAGGCKLTEPQFALRLKELLQYQDLTIEDIELLKIGRHFRVSPTVKFIISRTEEEEKKLYQFKRNIDILVIPTDYRHPVGLIRGEGINLDIIIKCASLILRYNSKAKLQPSAWVTITNTEKKRIMAQPRDAKVLGFVHIL